MANPFLQSNAPGYQGGGPRRRRRRPNQPQGNARGIVQNPQPPGAGDYWTRDRMQNARPLPMPQPGPTTGGFWAGTPSRPNPIPPIGPGPTYGGGGRPGANPNSLMDVAGHDPLSKQRYWANQGWLYNPQQGFRYVGNNALSQYLDRGGNQTGGRPNPGGQIMPGGANQPPRGGGVNGTPLMPLDPVYEAERRMIEDQLAAALGMYAPLRSQVAAQTNLMGERLNTNEGVDKSRLLESLASRGAFGGGIQRQDEGYLGTDYLRQRQDLANSAAGQYSDIAMQEGAARLAYMQALQEALLASAGRSAADPYAVIDQTMPGGGGGGNWKPSWKPRNRRRGPGGGR